MKRLHQRIRRNSRLGGGPLLADSGNHLIWRPGETGRYEVYYLTLNDLRTKTGYWVRYTLNAPSGSSGTPYAQLWFSRFDHRDPDRNFGLKQKYSIESLKCEKSPFLLNIGENILSDGRAEGRIAGCGREAAWNLEWSPAEKSTRYLPDLIYATDFADTKVLSPTISTLFEGKIRIDGETVPIEGQPGYQVHLWGRKHANAWAWLHCNAFEGHPGTAVEGLSVRLKKGGLITPPLTLLYLRHEGKEYRFHQFRHALTAKSRFSLGEWTFSTGDGTHRIEGRAECERKHLILAEYADPDGEESFCANSEVGALKLTLKKRRGAGWRTAATLESSATAHMEFASRTRPDVERKIAACDE